VLKNDTAWSSCLAVSVEATRLTVLPAVDDVPTALAQNGLIRRIEMIGGSVPFHLNSPWGGLSGR
jgi:hypothetical protein